jgi:hypothetical protein
MVQENLSRPNFIDRFFKNILFNLSLPNFILNLNFINKWWQDNFIATQFEKQILKNGVRKKFIRTNFRNIKYKNINNNLLWRFLIYHYSTFRNC